jgi:hypothetical protein
MPITRREILKRIAWSAGAGVATVHSILPLSGQSPDATDALTRRVRSDLEKHAALGDKFSAGPGDTATANWIAERLRGYGYRLEVSEFDAPFFVKKTAQLRAGAAFAEVAPQAPVVPTGGSGVTAPLAIVEGESTGDVRGRIAMIITPFGRHAALGRNAGIGLTVTRAAEAGARAVVIVTMGPSGEAIALNAPEKPFVPIPAAVLAPKNAAALIDAARRRTEATLVLDGDATPRPCKNVIGRVERGNRWIVLSTPRSGWYGCVAERGTGTAAFLEMAQWVLQRFPDLSVFVMNTGGHEFSLAGSHRVLHLAPPPASTLAWVHLGATLAVRDAVEKDGRLVMLDTADPERTLMATDSARNAAAEAFRGLSGYSPPGPIRPGAGELPTFVSKGYTTAFAVIATHRWFHTVEDTLERVDARLVVPVLRAHQRALELILSS